ncbi:MAG TPA: hypothetical protein VK272_02885 [Solirubrobacteraceae bacterium]|nr:hypothetical protein [Solirubrobacteraceae bacterium]
MSTIFATAFGTANRWRARILRGADGRLATALAAASATALLNCGSSAGDVMLASGLPQAPKVSASGQAFAWSTYEPSTGAWRLVVRRSGETQVLPIAARSTPFDVDLGDDGHGELVASYSRCSVPAQRTEPPHGCRLYFYDFAIGTERPIAVANAPGYSQFDPSMAAGRVAFARIEDRRLVGAGNRARLYVQSLTGGKPRRLPGGLENDDPRTGPTALDLSATALAFGWDAHGATVFEPFSVATSQISVDDLSGAQTLVALATSGEISAYEELSPTLADGTVDYGETGIEEGANTHVLRSLSLPGAHAGQASAPANLQSTATSSAGTIYSRCVATSDGFPVGPPCEVALAERTIYTDPDKDVAHTARPTTISMSPQQSIEQSPGHVPGNWLAWSSYDPAGRDYRLILRGPGGAAKAAPVPPRPVPFDVELGPRAGGGLIAVYSRCRVEPRLDPRDSLALPATGRGCRLYRYNIGATGEQAIPGSGSRFLPSVWNGELAFVAVQHDGTPALFLGSLNARSAPRRLAAGPAGSNPALGPRALVLREGRAAFVWEYRTPSGLRSELRMDGPGARSRLLDSAASRNGSVRELSPSFTRGALAWARREADGHSRIEVFGLSSQHLDAYLAPDPIEALATNHLVVINHLATGETLYACGNGHEGVTIRRLVTRLRQLPLQTVE